MSINRKDFSLTELADKFDFIKELHLYKFYQEIDKLYEDEVNSKECKTNLFSGIDDPYVITFLIKVSGILKRLLNKEIYVNDIKKLEGKECIYLKYWIYDKLIKLGFDRYDVNMSFHFLKKNKKGCISFTSSEKPCNFYKLSLKDIYNMKNLYDYSELLFKGDMNVYDKISEDSKYLDYFKNGLNLYKSSKTRCPTDRKNEYCYEFNEYEKIHTKHKTKLPSFSCREKLLSSLYKKETNLNGELSQDGKSYNTIDPDLYKLLVKDNLIDKKHLYKFYGLLEKHNGKYNTSNCNTLKDYPIKENAICELMGRVEDIFKIWDNTYATYEKLTSSETCNYLSYWLHDKLSRIDANPCDIEIFYILWHKYTMEKSKNKNKCYNEKYYGFNKEELENKKKLFDFLIYYKIIKDKIKEPKNENKNDYCQYIKVIFELYKKMEQKNISHSYSEELKLFRNNFSSNRELYYLEENCPDMCLGFVFNKKFNTLCPFEEKNTIELEKINLNQCENLESSKVPGQIDKNNDENYSFSTLPTATVYNELNGNIKTNTFYNICSQLIPYDKNHCGIYNLCTKLVRNLKKLSTLEKKERTDRCEYITHWLYHEIWKNTNIISENIYENVALREFFNVGYEVLRKLDITDCFFNTMNINFYEEKEKKYLHDYFKSHEKINDENICKDEECKKYCKYILFINDLYRKYINKCCYCFKSEGCMEIYPSYFKCNDIYNPHKLFEKLQCSKLEEFRGKIRNVDTPVPEDHYVKMLTEISVKEPHLLNWGNKKHSIIPEVVYKKITSGPFNTFALGSFGFLGVFLILFILYKFTPLGSYFNNRDARNKKSYFENFEQEFLEDDVEFNHGNMQNRRMRIAYSQV
ncbi:PIR Superfamily Protein [Plasmodium ovale wallikeri]|uniref:PIR Superfamily Protein n=1 Tax=Plasmodium ovale wallikeri TaxID=864142 RepID=A0A1A9AN96_PLAOA|nr:PIR Superfamily Protein [Plasmodium ovale wallikeri]